MDSEKVVSKMIEFADAFCIGGALKNALNERADEEVKKPHPILGEVFAFYERDGGRKVVVDSSGLVPSYSYSDLLISFPDLLRALVQFTKCPTEDNWSAVLGVLDDMGVV